MRRFYFNNLFINRRFNFAAFFTMAALILVWALVCRLKIVPPYMLPSPAQTLEAFLKDFPVLMHHLGRTLFEAFSGLMLSVMAAFILAIIMDTNKTIKKAISPIVFLTQTIPVIALAPLLVLWLGYGAAPKIAIVFLTCFFPVTMALLSGFEEADADSIRLLKSMGAGRVQIYRYIKVPLALPSLFSGLKVSLSYAIIGAVIAEWLGGDAGLGVYMTRVRKSYSFDKMFAVIILVSFITFVLIKILEQASALCRHGKSTSR